MYCTTNTPPPTDHDNKTKLVGPIAYSFLLVTIAPTYKLVSSVMKIFLKIKPSSSFTIVLFPLAFHL